VKEYEALAADSWIESGPFDGRFGDRITECVQLRESSRIEHLLVSRHTRGSPGGEISLELINGFKVRIGGRFEQIRQLCGVAVHFVEFGAERLAIGSLDIEEIARAKSVLSAPAVVVTGGQGFEIGNSLGICFAFPERREVQAIDFLERWQAESGEQSRGDIGRSCDLVNDCSARHARSAQDERNSLSGVVDRVSVSEFIMLTEALAMVGSDDNQGFF